MSEGLRPSEDTLPFSEARHVDQICDRFEDAWIAGLSPRIEDYLSNEAEPRRSALLRELLRLELHHRRQRGDSPTSETYLALFPQHRDLIATLFPRDESTGSRPPAMPTIPGYEIVSELGRGSMGVVYRARQLKLGGRPVAIKVLLPGGPVDRFLREAKLLAKVNSSFVVAVYDFDILPDGSPLLIMEWVEGADLLKTIRSRGGTLPEEEVSQWMRQTSEGMLAAAEQGIIHRDLKPSNVLIDRKGRARVADFGLARGPQGPGDLTLTGGVMGTPFYMAPEQAEDPRLVDTRADVYSFGATFYHALTGSPPFSGETVFSILFKHKTEPLTSPRERNPALSGQISEILERCLAKAPAERFASFAEILKHLQPSRNVSSPWEASDDAELADYLSRYRARRAAYLSEQRAWNEDLDIYTFPRGQVVRIMRGDIVAQRVDALVSSDTSILRMAEGVSAALRAVAGNVVAEEAMRQAPVRPGRALVTSAGGLPAHLIFHGVTVGFVKDRLIHPSRDLITEIMASCFYHADTHAIRSIAFPLLGTGAQEFPQDICLDTMFQFLARMFLRGLTPVREARIVIFN
jgi:serine/threonine protein kinase